jgi:hypothetical protein
VFYVSVVVLLCSCNAFQTRLKTVVLHCATNWAKVCTNFAKLRALLTCKPIMEVLVRVSAWATAILIDIFVVSLHTAIQISGECLRLDHDHFVQDSLQFIIRCNATIRHYVLSAIDCFTKLIITTRSAKKFPRYHHIQE